MLLQTISFGSSFLILSRRPLRPRPLNQNQGFQFHHENHTLGCQRDSCGSNQQRSIRVESGKIIGLALVGIRIFASKQQKHCCSVVFTNGMRSYSSLCKNQVMGTWHKFDVRFFIFRLSPDQTRLNDQTGHTISCTLFGQDLT